MNSDKDRPGTRHGGRFVAAFALSLLACAVVSITPGPASAANVSRQLDAKAAAAGSSSVPVVITLTEQAATEARRGESADLIRDLRRTAERSQRSVLAKLDGPSKRYWLVNAISTTVDAAELDALRNDPAVASIELDPQVNLTGVDVGSGPGSWGVDAVHAPEAWAQYGLTGTGVRVGSIDTGVDPTNPELAGAIAGWKDFVGGQPTPYDDNGHGTHTVGTMVARNISGAHIGVAPGATVLVAKAMSANGSASGSTLLAAAQWMTDPDGNPATADYPTVINNSWTSTGANNEWFRPMVQAWVALGIVPVFGAGNTAGSIGNPASYPESIAVGQLEQSGTVAINSSRGLVSWTAPDGSTTQVSKPDLTAPGAFISSTVGGGYGLYSGSSMAAPHVAAAVALLRQARPDLSVDAIRELLRASANDRGIPGPDLDYGAGALDITAALAATGAPSIAAPAAAISQPTAGSAAPSAATTVRLLRVVRRGGNLVVKGRVSGPAHLRFALRPTRATAKQLTGTATLARTTISGTFSIKVPVKRLARRTYILVVTASNDQGKRLGGTSVSVRLR
jgi:subtilisin family serine protease